MRSASNHWGRKRAILDFFSPPSFFRIFYSVPCPLGISCIPIDRPRLGGKFRCAQHVHTTPRKFFMTMETWKASEKQSFFLHFWMSKIGDFPRFSKNAGKCYTSDRIFISSDPMTMIWCAIDNMGSEEHFVKLNQPTIWSRKFSSGVWSLVIFFLEIQLLHWMIWIHKWKVAFSTRKLPNFKRH